MDGANNGVGADGMLPVVDYYDDEESANRSTSTSGVRILGMAQPPAKLQRRESDCTSAYYGEDSRSEAPTNMTESAYYARDDDDDDDSSHCSVDFDLDPADAISGGIPVDRV